MSLPLLLSLPWELRDTIWRHVLVRNHPLIITTPGAKRGRVDGLLYVCKQIQNECSTIFWRENTFSLDWTRAAQSFAIRAPYESQIWQASELLAIPRAHLQDLRSILIDIAADDYTDDLSKQLASWFFAQAPYLVRLNLVLQACSDSLNLHFRSFADILWRQFGGDVASLKHLRFVRLTVWNAFYLNRHRRSRRAALPTVRTLTRNRARLRPFNGNAALIGSGLPGEFDRGAVLAWPGVCPYCKDTGHVLEPSILECFYQLRPRVEEEPLARIRGGRFATARLEDLYDAIPATVQVRKTRSKPQTADGNGGSQENVGPQGAAAVTGNMSAQGAATATTTATTTTATTTTTAANSNSNNINVNNTTRPPSQAFKLVLSPQTSAALRQEKVFEGMMVGPFSMKHWNDEQRACGHVIAGQVDAASGLS